MTVPFRIGKRIADIETLAQSPLLTRLDNQSFGFLIDNFDHVEFAEGLIQREGDSASEIFILLEGQVTTYRNQMLIRHLRPGDYFGELALVGVMTVRLTVEANTPVRLAALSKNRFETLVHDHPSVVYGLLQTIAASLGDQVGAITDRMVLLTRERSLPRRSMVKVTMPDGVRQLTTGTAISELIQGDSLAPTSVAALLDNKPVALNSPVLSDSYVQPIGLEHREGREIYRRSVGLLVLEAARKVAPQARVRIGPAVAHTQVAAIEGSIRGSLEDFVTQLATKTEQLRRLDTPFRTETWSVEEAKTHLLSEGWVEAAGLLRTKRDATVELVSCGDLYAVSQGPLLPSTGKIKPIRIYPHRDGALLDLSDALCEHLPQCVYSVIEHEMKTPRFDGEMVQEHRRWLNSLGVSSTGGFNEACVSGQVSQIIRVSEGFHEKQIAKIADKIVERHPHVKMICVAGPSSSGKTTFIKRLLVQLEVNGVRAHALSLDDYYIDREKTPRDEKGEYDFESLLALDLDLLRNQTKMLLEGRQVTLAKYDFLTGKSLPSGGQIMRIDMSDLLVVEGIHGLNPALFADTFTPEQIFRVFIHPATTLTLDRFSSVAPSDLRLLRRIVRDRHTRGYKASDNLSRWDSVQAGEEQRIYPFFSTADAVFDTALVYEPSVIKVFAERYLLEVPEKHPTYPTAYRLRQLLDRFVTIYPDHVPPTSILREFIGGSGFEY